MQLADFYRYVQPAVPGCPDELMRQAIVEAVQTLCNKARVWRELQEPMPLQSGVNEYEIDAPLGARVVSVELVMCGARRLRPVTLSELSWMLPDWQTARGGDPAFYMGANDWGSIKVYPMPVDPVTPLAIRAEYEPKIEATQLPDFLLQRYQKEVANGAKASLLNQVGVSWANPLMAAQLQARFDAQVVDATIKMIHERNAGSIRVQPIAFR